VYLDYSRGAADWIVATAQKQGGLRHWGDETDIISGAAGIGLFLLEMHKATGDRRYAECAFGAADWLISQGEKVDGSLKWKSRSSLDRFYTGFSHGTAGVAYFLAKAYESSKEPRYLEHAKAGAAWLMKNAVHERQGVKWFHYEPGHEREFMTGWCHGPAGTCRLFLELHNLTGDAQYLETAKKGAAWLMATLDPASRNAPYHGLSMCCGAAGVGDFFLDLFLATKDEEYLEYAGRVATFLLDRAKSTENGWKWTNYDVPDKTGKIYYGTGHMVGAAGVGSFFLRLHTVLNNMEDRFVSSVDKLPAMPTPERKAKRSYVILTNAPETDAYFEAAKKLSSAHNGSIVRFDPAKMLALRRKLSSLNPRYVAIVLKPQDIDINLQRQMIALSTRMDDDPFCDFAFGFVTGATAKESVSLVERSLRVPREGLPKTIVTASVTSGRKSSVLSGAGMVLAKQLGYEGKAIYWSCVESDPQVLGFVRSHIKEVQKNGVVIFTGNGDPEGIWLFSDRRNLDASRHWPFDPTKVGYDPRGEMPRITAEYFRGVDLGGAVVWSGTCHSGVLHRAFVENDIVSTFGKVDRVTEYTIPPGRSLGLAILSDGPSAYLAPIGPNHGYACSVELHRALSAGLSLGDVMRSRYNEIILGGGGNLDISLYEPDGPMLSENPMRGGGANRTLYGDPLLSPFPNSGKDYLRRRLASLPNGSLRVTCEVVDETAPMFWDMFGNDPQNPERIYTVVELPKGFDHVGTVSASAKAVTGKEISLSPCKWGIEKIDGKTLVHLQVNGLRGALSRQGTTVEFTLLPAKRN
jgi:rhamnogalacturonyl hydrolase YesR